MRADLTHLCADYKNFCAGTTNAGRSYWFACGFPRFILQPTIDSVHLSNVQASLTLKAISYTYRLSLNLPVLE